MRAFGRRHMRAYVSGRHGTACRRWSSSCRRCVAACPLLDPLPTHQHRIGHAHPDQASLHVHACAGHLGPEGEGIIHHDDAGCLVLWCLVRRARAACPKRQPSRYAACVDGGSQAPRAWSARATAHTVCSCRDRLYQIWKAARHSCSQRRRRRLRCAGMARAQVDHSTSDLRRYFG